MIARSKARAPARRFLPPALVVAALGALTAVALLPGDAEGAAHHTQAESAARADVVAQTGVPGGLVFLQRWQSVMWADACLGAPAAGEACAQVQTPGFVIWLRAGDQFFRYHTDVAGTEVRLAETRVGHPGVFSLPADAVSRPVDLVTPLPAPVPPAPVPPEPAPGTYLVQPGDTLGNLAVRYGTTVAALAQANNIVNVDLIFVGQVLQIPGAAPAALPSPAPEPASVPDPAPPADPPAPPAPAAPAPAMPQPGGGGVLYQ